MKLLNPIIGKNLQLRSAEPKDAAFILSLRLNPKLNQYIGKTDPSVKKQEQWIEERLGLEHDCHMIIEDFKEKSLGTIAIYDIDEERKRAEWGRWLIDPKAPFFVAFESAILMYKFSFTDLMLEYVYNGVQNANTKSLNFHRQFGGDIMKANDQETWFSFRTEHFEKILTQYQPFHNITLNPIRG